MEPTARWMRPRPVLTPAAHAHLKAVVERGSWRLLLTPSRGEAVYLTGRGAGKPTLHVSPEGPPRDQLEPEGPQLCANVAALSLLHGIPLPPPDHHRVALHSPAAFLSHKGFCQQRKSKGFACHVRPCLIPPPPRSQAYLPQALPSVHLALVPAAPVPYPTAPTQGLAEASITPHRLLQHFLTGLSWLPSLMSSKLQ